MSLLFLVLGLVLAAEPDNFVGRNTPPQNEIVNRYFQDRIQKDIVDVHNAKNKNRKSCNEELISSLLEKTFDRNFPDVYEIMYKVKIDGPDFSQLKSSVLDGQLPINKFFVPSMALRLNGRNHSVGIDKIDHFFSHGYLYWKAIGEDPDLPPEKIAKVLKLGMDQEESTWGLKGPGIKSYGDLAANYQGLHFWRDLRHGKPPILSCQKGRLVVTKKLRFEDYMDGAVDEAVNCSSYSNSVKAMMIVGRTRTLKRACPVAPDVCESLQKKYPSPLQESLLHPLCRGLEHNQIERPSSLTTKEILDTASAALSGVDNLFVLFFGPKKAAEVERNERPAPQSGGVR